MESSIQGQPTYEELATLIALDLAPLFEPTTDGKFEIEHFADNHFDVPCDALTRLGVLDAINPHRHRIRVDWCPGKPLPLWRNKDEPSYDELVLCVVRIARWQEIWGYDIFRTDPNTSIQLPVERHYDHPLAVEYRRIVSARTAHALIRLGLGEWIDAELFVLTAEGDKIPSVATYWNNRKPPGKLR